MSTNTNMDMRAAFEKWYLQHLMDVHGVDEADARIYLKRDKDGNYVHSHTHISWTAYHQALSHTSPQPAITRERLVELIGVGETYHRDNPYDTRTEYEISADHILAELQVSAGK